MRIIILLILLFIATACGKGLTTHYIDPELEPYMQAFSDKYEVSLKNAVVVFDESPLKETLGTCNFGLISINREFFNKASEASRRILVFHEAGHWIGWGHDDHYDKYGCPTTFMSTIFPPGYCIQDVVELTY